MAALALLAAGGCWPSHPDAPEDTALDVFEQAEAHFAAGRYADAAPGYEFAIKYRDRWKEPYLKLARCHEALGHEEEAVKILERLLRVDRFDENGLSALGRLHAHRGSTDRALDCYRRLRDLRPEDRSLDGEIARLEALRKP
jgi:tetratricopeptide (TPR) repeat protein